jgi:hypothetical protein
MPLDEKYTNKQTNKVVNVEGISVELKASIWGQVELMELMHVTSTSTKLKKWRWRLN